MNDTEGKPTTPSTETAAWHFQLADEHHKKISPAATNLRAVCLRQRPNLEALIGAI
jgi:hypothetical protein